MFQSFQIIKTFVVVALKTGVSARYFFLLRFFSGHFIVETGRTRVDKINFKSLIDPNWNEPNCLEIFLVTFHPYMFNLIIFEIKYFQILTFLTLTFQLDFLYFSFKFEIICIFGIPICTSQVLIQNATYTKFLDRLSFLSLTVWLSIFQCI